MSSSLLLEDADADADAATLAAVLSFLDGADDSSSAIAGPSIAPSKRQKDAAAVKYTTQLQRKKRAEIATLRQQAKELQARLTNIQSLQRGGSSGCSPGLVQGLTRWREVALEERAERLRAEQTMRRLQVAAKHYRQLGDAILDVLKKRKWSEVDCRGVLSSPEPPRFPTLTVNISEPMMDTLRQEIAQLLAKTSAVFPSPASSRVTSSFETMRASNGAVSFVEIRTATPVQLASVEASSKIWRLLSTTSLRIYSHKRHTMIPGRDSRSVEKKFVMMVPAPVSKHPFASELGVRLNGMHLIQRYGPYTDGSTTIVTSAVVLFPPHGRVFREHKWIKVSPLSSGSSQPTAVMETCYRVFPGECQASNELEGDDRDAAFYLRTLSANTRIVMQRDQNAQLDGELFYQDPQ